MQFNEGAQLRKEWKEKKEKCDHPIVAKEYYLGTSTGDYICTTCGETHATKQEFQK